MTADATLPLRYPRAESPPLGEPVEIAPGVLWLRLPLPYALDHVNVYLFEEEGGWGLFDTGISDDPSYEVWERVLAGPLGGRPITRLVVSHFHPDHVGLAGWLANRFGPTLFMPQAEYLYCRLLQTLPPSARNEDQPFYQALGLGSDEIQRILNRGKSYLQRVTGLPPAYHRLIAGERLALGNRSWAILTGGGHAPEQGMLWNESDRLFISADQVLARISPNVSVVEVEPTADPLGLYLDSLDSIRQSVPDDVLVLPGHDLPFWGLHERIERLIGHHAHRCDLIEQACREDSRNCVELLPVLFHRRLDPHMMSFALGEALAHLNYLVRRGRLRADEERGVVRYRSI
jgi:glyoxylase-like metal-dependent hydrolase (beta-lactamase superfamily II)